MTTLNQFSSLLDKIENDELKAELKGAFDNVTGVFNEAIETRDKAKEQNRELKEFKSKIGGLIDVDGDFTVADIEKKINDNSKGGDLETVKAELSSKYEKDMETLRTEIANKESSINELTNKYNDTLFNNAIVDSGLLAGFVDEPMARKNITEMVKSKLMYEDGKVFVKDSVTGEKAKDIKTGEFLTANSVIDDIKGSINPMYLARETTGSGSGVPNNQAKPTNNKKFNDYTSGELVELRRTNPTEYDRLKQQG